jgi:FtsP/CotA-like multicopper oxidase with cupredoxin domain
MLINGSVRTLAALVVLAFGIAVSGPAQAHDHHAGADVGGMSGDAYWSAVAGHDRGGGHLRTYYIEADEVSWDYAPSGRNQVTGEPFDDKAATYTQRTTDRIGSKYLKCLYRSYSDDSFHEQQKQDAGQRYLGFLGPVIRAEVGDTIKVIFHNTCRLPASVHPHGVFYDKANEGAPYADQTTGNDKLDDAVPRNGTYTYTWTVPERAGPGPHDGSSVMWMYHSHTSEVADAYAGLMGPMVITAKGLAREDGSPRDVDREVFELFMVVNENLSPYEGVNRTMAGLDPALAEDPRYVESNMKYAINGYTYANQPIVTLKRNERVRWYVMSMGDEVDLHTPHWHGNTVLVGGMRMDVVSLLPAGMLVADMVPDNAGIWLFHCHVADHYTGGMISRYEVRER